MSKEIKIIKTNDTWSEMEKLVTETVENYKSDFYAFDYDTYSYLKDGSEFIFAVRKNGTHFNVIPNIPDLMEKEAQYITSVYTEMDVNEFYLIKKNESITEMTYGEVIDYMKRKLLSVIDCTEKRMKEINKRFCDKGLYVQTIREEDVGINMINYSEKILSD